MVVASVVVAAGSGGFDKGPRPLSESLCHVDLRNPVFSHTRESRILTFPLIAAPSPLPRHGRVPPGSRGATSTLNRHRSTCRRLTTSRPRNPLVGHDLGHDDPPPLEWARWRTPHGHPPGLPDPGAQGCTSLDQLFVPSKTYECGGLSSMRAPCAHSHPVFPEADVFRHTSSTQTATLSCCRIPK